MKPTDARAHVWQGRPGCVACGGLGTIHQQVKGQLRVVRVPCGCTREHTAEDYERAKAQGERA
jgi:hypothetical protein